MEQTKSDVIHYNDVAPTSSKFCSEFICSEEWTSIVQKVEDESDLRYLLKKYYELGIYNPIKKRIKAMEKTSRDIEVLFAKGLIRDRLLEEWAEGDLLRDIAINDELVDLTERTRVLQARGLFINPSGTHFINKIDAREIIDACITLYEKERTSKQREWIISDLFMDFVKRTIREREVKDNAKKE